MTVTPAIVASSDHYRKQLQAGGERLKTAYLHHQTPADYLKGRSQLVDEVLCQLWLDYDLNSKPWAFIAVGGYGRGELFPYSDVDCLVLIDKPPHHTEEALISQFIGQLWDLGLEVGHSVRTIGECIEKSKTDITIQTCLLESRLLIGSESLYAQFRLAVNETLNVAAFYQSKRAEQAERHLRADDASSNLEPNCKESPGGLRDLHLLRWIALAAGFGTSWPALIEANIISSKEARDLERAERQLHILRISLHLSAARAEDRLLFEQQTAMAEQHGFLGSQRKRPSEQLMQRYYRTTAQILRLTTMAIRNIGERIFPERASTVHRINDRFQKRWVLLDIQDDQVFTRYPDAIFECFQRMQADPELKGLSSRTERALLRALDQIDPHFRSQKQHRLQFLSLLQSPRGVLHECRRMHQLGILGRYLPAFGRIIGQMQHDLFHIYTVDQHTLMVLRNLRRLGDERFFHEFPECSQLMANFDRPWVIYVAALFHDIAKGRGGDHSELGEADAARFCQQHEIQGDDARLIPWLVRQHLSMSRIAQKEDISDPEVVTRFANLVETPRALTALYLLTVADIRGTSPKVWNQWKGKLLSDLYRSTLSYLQQGDSAPTRSIVTERQAEAMKHLRFFALSDTVHQQLWKQLDDIYFIRHSAEEIAWHTRSLYYRLHQALPIVCARPYEQSGLQVMVYTPNHDGLFVSLVGYFTNAGYNILESRIHTTSNQYALDSFILMGNSEDDVNREKIALIEHELPLTLQNGHPIRPPARGWLSRWVKHFPILPEVALLPDNRGQHYVLEIHCADRRGLLYQIANTLQQHRIDVHSAKIATLGERAEDVFLVSGGDLHSAQGRIRLESNLVEQLSV